MMAKHWVPGLVKSRLGKDTGLAIAAEIHKYFVNLLGNQLATTADFRCVFVSPDDACSNFKSEVGPHWITNPQGDGDLGTRMERAFKSLLTTTDDLTLPRMILIGADLPTLTSQDLEAAFEKLVTHEVVLGPAEDGGYYLIGLRGPWRNDFSKLFQSIDWSTSRVFEQTLNVIRSHALDLSLLGMREDIDTIEALNRLLLSTETDSELKKAVYSLLADGSNPSSKD